MALSNFRVDYHDGIPDIDQENLNYFNETVQDWTGGSSALEPVNDPNQAQVLMQIESSPEKLHTLKANSLYTWVADVDWVDNL